MRVLFCKIHCPSFICFCKPSSHIYKAGPLKLENSPHVPSTTGLSLGGDASDIDHDHVSGETIKVEEESMNGNRKQQPQPQPQQQEAGENYIKSSIKRPSSNSREVQKKSVQWMDFLGKELVEIREFEASESEDMDNEGDVGRGCDRKGCFCTIL